MNSTIPRLIEVDMPIRRVSEQARREKEMRRCHVPLMYVWPATRPPAACRAVLCCALWPDPANPDCPPKFREAAKKWMGKWSSASYLKLLSPDSFERFVSFQKQTQKLDDNVELRSALLDFVAEFANFDNATRSEFLETAQALTLAAHEALTGVGGKPLIVDTFAGGGAIPLESLRVGADAFASDSNPVAVVFNKIVLEYIPRFGAKLIDEVRLWGKWAQIEAGKELGKFYPKDPDGATPIAYLWARTVRCEGPGCGAEVPLIRTLWLARSGSVACRLVPDKKEKQVHFEIMSGISSSRVGSGTIKRGSATCPVCGYTTPVASVRRQLKERRGGAATARLFCVVTTREDEQGRFYRAPTNRDLEVARLAAEELKARSENHADKISLVPDEYLPVMSGVFNAPIYGHDNWGTLFTPRQALALSTYTRLANQYVKINHRKDPAFAIAVGAVLSLVVSRLADLNASLCGWQLSTPNTAHVFTRWALPMMMDFGEINPLAAAGGSPESAIRRIVAGMQGVVDGIQSAGSAEMASATNVPLPDDAANAFVTDPPYYNAVPYADISDFFYVWMRRSIGELLPDLFGEALTPKESEICEMAGWDSVRYPNKNGKWFEERMREAMSEGRRILRDDGIGVVVFAHKSTSGWEAQLQAMIDAGWTITASWPIDTEMGSRLRAQNSAVLASSIHIVCRPRETLGTSQAVGDWRDVLHELPKRIHEWMPRLADEGVVGADAIFACLGPALEIFSRFSRVEKANGEKVNLKEYLIYVWAAVAKEALAMVFKGADASGFEEDARLTAMWLWTLFAGQTNNGLDVSADENEESEETTDNKNKGYILEYDAARKIAQGLGADLESMQSLVEIKGETATLLSVAERTKRLFGKDDSESSSKSRKKKKAQLQLGFISELEQAEEAGSWGSKGAPSQGATVLDRVHQSMILFAAGRSEALRRFLVDEGVGRDERFWRLAQVLSFLYPKTSDEKRWIDGVLARKKGLGF
jgi:putative DNA methylase